MLDEIIKNKELEVANLKITTNFNMEQLIDNNDNAFLSRLKKVSQEGQNAIIAEIKRKSPSKGVLNAKLDTNILSKMYEDNGAACISVLTDEKYFGGSINDLSSVKSNVTIPVLRKDFIIDEYQLLESKYYGADCVLLIIACLSEQKFQSLLEMCKMLNLCALVEVHTLEEMKIALKHNAYLVGINNRNLKTFEVNLDTSIQLAKFKNDNVLFISESGLKDKKTIDDLKNKGIDAFLIGESLVTSSNPSNDLRVLVGKC